MVTPIPQIDIHEAKNRLDEGNAVFVDIRDPGSFEEAHISGATHLTDNTVESFVSDTAKDGTVIVYCYHGNSSLMGANYLKNAGFTDVYSMAGGFEAWRAEYPSEA